MVSMYYFQEIRALLAQGKNKSEIARQLRLSRTTVRKYASSNSPPCYKSRSTTTREDPLAGYYERITSLLETAPKLTASEVFEWLVERGYEGSERTVQRRFKLQRDQTPKERDFDQIYEPGEQAQFDFKESLELPFASGIQLVHLHVSTLPFSDHYGVKAYPGKNYECFMDGVHSFFESIGGMTKNIRFDNLSPVVAEVLTGGGRKYTKKFTEATQHYGFGLLPCSPGRGNEKGDVEREIRTLSRRFLNFVAVERIVFKDFAQLNDELSKFTAKRQSEEAKAKLKIEQGHLHPLPRRDEDVICRSGEARATDFGTVNLMKSTYSVPDEVIGVLCWVVPGPYDVKIYRNDTRTLVATHPRQKEGDHSILLEHCLRGLLRKPRAMIRWAHRAILFPSTECHRFYRRLKAQDEYHAEREYLRTINLVQQVPMAEILTAMQLVLETDQVGFESVKELLLTDRRPENIIEMKQINQSPIVPNLGAYDELIPKTGGGRP